MRWIRIYKEHSSRWVKEVGKRMGEGLVGTGVLRFSHRYSQTIWGNKVLFRVTVWGYCPLRPYNHTDGNSFRGAAGTWGRGGSLCTSELTTSTSQKFHNLPQRELASEGAGVAPHKSEKDILHSNRGNWKYKKVCPGGRLLRWVFNSGWCASWDNIEACPDRNRVQNPQSQLGQCCCL